MTEIQGILLGLLRAFDTICRKYDAEYFLTGGSALGAIRHNGFIPWDDDIDLGMTRPMWEKIRPHLMEELPDGIVLVDCRTHERYRNPIAKIVNTNSAVLYRAALADECPKGQFIEVFTHDPVPADHMVEHKRDFLTYCELMAPYFSVFDEKFMYKNGLTDEELDLIQEYYKAKKRAETEGLEKVLSELESKFSRYSYEDADYQILNWGVNACYYPIENFGGVRYEKFEDMQVPVARRACDNLRIDYGNSWTNYPPKQYQVAHVTVGDEFIPGDEYMKLINRQITPEKTRAMRENQKAVFLEMLPDKVGRSKEIYAVQMRHAKLVEKRTGDLGKLYGEGRYAEIIERFEEYILLKKRLKNYTFTDDISSAGRDYIARALVMQGRVSDAENVLNIPRNLRVGEGSTGTVNDILRITKANSCYYDHFHDEARKLLNEVEGDLGDSLTAWLVRARLDIEEGNPAADVRNMAAAYPDNMEITKILADTLVLENNMAEADRLYDRILEESNNGMDILDIRHKRAERA